ncbi:hypothetical protein [Pleurocapsa sp. PCC 7319]|uniref:hypothetical protein n=1 Tax=Pleurocapsa sp. PCC 7319 TaxID=118161 RepID=UPI00034A077E|nr:hypothetical protein [Pleurocapsa sp. PCC 7319]
MEITLSETWKLWLSDNLPADAILWGISIFWWERIGKVMQFLGATTIVADIIGPEKIRKFGTSLQSTNSPKTLIQFLKRCFAWYVVIFRQTIMKDYTRDSTNKESKNKFFQLNILNYAICFLLTVFTVFLAELHIFNWFFLVEAIFIFGCLLVSIAPLFTVLAIVTVALLGLTINSILLRPLAHLLEHPSLDRLLKIASLLLLLLGFFGELLGS